MTAHEKIAVLIGLALVVWWLSLIVYPWKKCARCKGGGKKFNPLSLGRQNTHRNCGRCGGSGRLPRWGTRTGDD